MVATSALLVACSGGKKADEGTSPPPGSISTWITSAKLDEDYSWTIYQKDELINKYATQITLNLANSKGEEWSLRDTIGMLEFKNTFQFDVQVFNTTVLSERSEVKIQINSATLQKPFLFTFNIRVLENFVKDAEYQFDSQLGNFKRNYFVGEPIGDINPVRIKTIWTNGDEEIICATDSRVRIIGFSTDKVAHGNEVFFIIDRAGIMFRYNVTPASPGNDFSWSGELYSDSPATFFYHDSLNYSTATSGGLTTHFYLDDLFEYGFWWTRFNRQGGITIGPGGQITPNPSYTFPYESMTKEGYKEYMEKQGFEL